MRLFITEILSETIRSKIELAGRKLVALETVKIVKEIGPREQQLAFDLKVV